MALVFDGTGSLSLGSAVINTYPATFVFAYANNASSNAEFTVLAQKSATLDRSVRATFENAGSRKYAIHRTQGLSINATKSTPPSPNTTALQFGAIVFTSKNSRTVYFGDSTGVTDETPAADSLVYHNMFYVGSYDGASSFAKGSIAEVHVYRSALLSADIGDIIAGELPETVAGWVDGWSLEDYSAGSTYVSLGGTRTLTAYGGVAQSSLAHPVTRSGTSVTAIGTGTGSGSGGDAQAQFNATAIGGTGTGTGSGSGGDATGVVVVDATAIGGTGTGTGSGSGGDAQAQFNATTSGGIGVGVGSGYGGAAVGSVVGAIWPDPSNVLLGVTYGPTGADYTGTATGGVVDYESIAAAVLAALQATTIPVDSVKMNGAQVIGDGSEANPWRGVGV